jgi:hypothetical protein
MSDSTFTLLYVGLSLIGIVSGVVVAFGMLGAKRLPGLTEIFLLTTFLTSATRILVHSTSFVFGIISLAILAVAIYALYVGRLAGFWRWVYVIGAVVALYLNCAVVIAQAFEKLPVLHPLARTPPEPTFMVAQMVVMNIFMALGIGAVYKFNPAPR